MTDANGTQVPDGAAIPESEVHEEDATASDEDRGPAGEAAEAGPAEDAAEDVAAADAVGEDAGDVAAEHTSASADDTAEPAPEDAPVAGAGPAAADEPEVADGSEVEPAADRPDTTPAEESEPSEEAEPSDEPVSAEDAESTAESGSDETPAAEAEPAVDPEATDATDAPDDETVGRAATENPSEASTDDDEVAAPPARPTGRTRRAWLSGEPSPEPESAAALTADRLLEPRRAAPEGGWRRLLYDLTGGRINAGDSSKVRARRLLDTRVQAALPGRARFVATLTRKGGVGKTTVTTLLGMMLASLREDRVVALDANPDRGTLAERVPRSSDATVRDIVRDAPRITSFTQLSDMVSRDASRLDVVASETDPDVAQAFGEEDYDIVTDVLARYYSIILTDSGTGMVHSVMAGTLARADQLVLVSGASVDESRLASETLTWLEAHRHEDLVRQCVVVLNASNPEARAIDTEEIADHFRSRVRAVVHIPYDPHLAEGATIRLDHLRPATLWAVREFAATVVDGLVESVHRTPEVEHRTVDAEHRVP